MCVSMEIRPEGTDVNSVKCSMMLVKSANGRGMCQNGKNQIFASQGSVIRNTFYSADWYKGRLTEDQLKELENPTTPKPKATKVSKRRNRPRPQAEE